MNYFNRASAINYLLTRYDTPTSYLEIGVQTGSNFKKISADIKVAVDPEFKIPGGFSNDKINTYHECTSDDFFNSRKKNERYHVVFVDGLHTYPQSYKDVENSLKYLHPNGVIVMHDCMPPNRAAAQRSNDVAKTMPEFNNVWNGDVWKTVVDLKSHRKDLDIFTINEDFGLGFVSFGSNKNLLKFSKDQIENMTYDAFNNNFELYMNLKPKEYLRKVFK